MPDFVSPPNLNAPGKLYARLSLTRDATDISLERQIRLGKEWFQANGITDIAIYTEPRGHRSGTSDEYRPAYRALLVDCKKGDTLWCHDQARFTRADDAPTVLRALHKRGVRIVFYDERVDVESATGMMAVRFRSLMNAQYATNVSESARRAYAGFKRSGAYYTRKPTMGLRGEGHGIHRKRIASTRGIWRIVANGKTFVVLGDRNAAPCPKKCKPVFLGFIDLVRAALELLVEKDVGCPTAARILNARGFMAHDGRGIPRAVTEIDVRSIREHVELYRGILDNPLLDSAAVRVAARRVNNGAGRRYHVRTQPPLLWRLIVCQTCGKPYRTGFDRTKYWYVHGHYSCADRHKYADWKLDSQVWAYLDRMRLPVAQRQDVARRVLSKHRAKPAGEDAEAAARRSKIQRALNNLPKLLAQEDISREEYYQLKLDYEAELSELTPAKSSATFWDHVTEVEIVDLWERTAETLQQAATMDTGAVNLVLREMFESVVIAPDGKLYITVRDVFKPLFA